MPSRILPCLPITGLSERMGRLKPGAGQTWTAAAAHQQWSAAWGERVGPECRPLFPRLVHGAWDPPAPGHQCMRKSAGLLPAGPAARLTNSMVGAGGWPRQGRRTKPESLVIRARGYKPYSQRPHNSLRLILHTRHEKVGRPTPRLLARCPRALWPVGGRRGRTARQQPHAQQRRNQPPHPAPAPIPRIRPPQMVDRATQVCKTCRPHRP